MIIKRLVSVYNAGGASAVVRAVGRRLRTPHARIFPDARAAVRDATGIEIGGPSPIFAQGGLMPVYPSAASVDNCNFAASTIWEGEITEGAFTFHKGRAPGRQFIAEGGDLRRIASASYDFVLSSHMIEHTANPLRALHEWKRVLRTGGTLVIIVPHRDGTFDHRRPVTALDHIRADFAQDTQENDSTHFAEVLALHDHTRDSGTHRMPFRERVERNAELRSVHQHVFDTRLVADVLREAGFALEAIEPLEPYHVVAIARKRAAGGHDDRVTDKALRAILRASPFRSDREASQW